MISVIIPTYNDGELIRSTISTLHENAYKRLIKEVIVVDGGSTDNTVQKAKLAGATVIRSLQKRRSIQMNLGASYASGKILYFMLPGSIPPKNFTNEIVRAIFKGYSFGLFTANFNYKHWLLDFICWLTKTKIHFARLESQSLFVLQELFIKAGKGFQEDLLMFEDHEIIKRFKRYSRFTVLHDHILVPINKYFQHGIVRTELSYFLSYFLYRLGFSQERLVKIHRLLSGEKRITAQLQNVLEQSSEFLVRDTGLKVFDSRLKV